MTNKRQLRLEQKNKIVKLTDDQRKAKSALACKNLVDSDEFKKASVVMFFLSLPSEVDTANAILQAWLAGKTVVVPKVSWQQRHMIPVEINSLESGLKAGKSGLKNPTTGLPLPIEDIDLVVTPGLAYDDKGNRLGRGGSYYDRFFASKRFKAAKCGFIFSDQMVDQIPMEDHDIPVDFLITDKGVTRWDQ